VKEQLSKEILGVALNRFALAPNWIDYLAISNKDAVYG
jgi:hypothetical protein